MQHEANVYKMSEFGELEALRQLVEAGHKVDEQDVRG